jgi:RNA polymerase sigma factor (sigma-70 family)
MAIDSENELVKQHTPLVVSIAFSYRPQPPNDYDDLISVGMIGLLKAIRIFDPSRGTQFSTLATKIIHREIIRELEKTNGKKHESLNFDVEKEEHLDFNDYLPENLTELEKTLLIDRFHLGMTFEEIGGKFGKTKQWANIKLSHVLNKIMESNEKKENPVAE